MPTKGRHSPKRKQGQKYATQRATAKAVSKSRIAKQDREYRRKLKELQRIGAYQPQLRTRSEKKSHKPKLTKSRKATINARFRKFEQVVKGDVYIFIPFPTRSEQKRKDLTKKAKRNRFLTTRKGIAVPKRKGTRSAKITKNRRGEYVIKVKRVKEGPTGKRRTTEVIPIEPFRTPEDEIDRIMADAELLGPLGPDESLRFRVELYAEGEGFSRHIFGDLDALRSYLQDRYDFEGYEDFAMEFFRSITVIKVSTSATTVQLREESKRRNAKRNARRAEYRARARDRKKRVQAMFGRLDRGEPIF